MIRAGLLAALLALLALLLCEVAWAQGERGGRGRAGQGRGEGRGSAAHIDTSMTIHEIAEVTGISEGEIADELGLPLNVDKDTPLGELGVRGRRMGRLTAHGPGYGRSRLADWKYPIYAVLVIFAGVYLLWLGIPRKADPKNRRWYYPQWVYVIVLVISVLVLGFYLGKRPNPMEAVVKVPKATVGIYEVVWPYIWALVFFILLAIVVNKGVCGWACPFGSLEELICMLPFFRRAKKRRLPFRITNTIRVALFVVFLLLIYGLIADARGFVIYHYINPFNLFNFDFSTSTVLPFIIAYLVVSFFFYRPFCQFVCPFGLISWIAERFSLCRIRIDFDRCIDCRACAKACPLTAAADRLARKAFPADCFSCMRCLRVCPEDAIHYRPFWGSPSPKPGPDPAS